MAVTELTFTQQSDGTYTSSFDSTGTKTAIQLNRAANEPLLIYVSADSGSHSVLYKNAGNNKENLVEIDLPAGLEVEIVSHCDVNYGAVVDGVAEDNGGVEK